MRGLVLVVAGLLSASSIMGSDRPCGDRWWGGCPNEQCLELLRQLNEAPTEEEATALAAKYQEECRDIPCREAQESAAQQLTALAHWESWSPCDSASAPRDELLSASMPVEELPCEEARVAWTEVAIAANELAARAARGCPPEPIVRASSLPLALASQIKDRRRRACPAYEEGGALAIYVCGPSGSDAAIGACPEFPHKATDRCRKVAKVDRADLEEVEADQTKPWTVLPLAEDPEEDPDLLSMLGVELGSVGGRPALVPPWTVWETALEASADTPLRLLGVNRHGMAIVVEPPDKPLPTKVPVDRLELPCACRPATEAETPVRRLAAMRLTLLGRWPETRFLGSEPTPSEGGWLGECAVLPRSANRMSDELFCFQARFAATEAEAQGAVTVRAWRPMSADWVDIESARHLLETLATQTFPEEREASLAAALLSGPKVRLAAVLPDSSTEMETGSELLVLTLGGGAIVHGRNGAVARSATTGAVLEELLDQPTAPDSAARRLQKDLTRLVMVKPELRLLTAKAERGACWLMPAESLRCRSSGEAEWSPLETPVGWPQAIGSSARAAIEEDLAGDSIPSELGGLLSAILLRPDRRLGEAFGQGPGVMFLLADGGTEGALKGWWVDASGRQRGEVDLFPMPRASDDVLEVALSEYRDFIEGLVLENAQRGGMPPRYLVAGTKDGPALAVVSQDAMFTTTLLTTQGKLATELQCVRRKLARDDGLPIKIMEAAEAIVNVFDPSRRDWANSPHVYVQECPVTSATGAGLAERQ